MLFHGGSRRENGGNSVGRDGGDGVRAEAERPLGAQLGAAPRRRAVWARTLWGCRSTRAMCAAGLVTNGVTGLVWGVVSVWARDAAGLSGAQRDAALGAYALGKGLVQLASGGLSDWLGRKWLVAGGLAANGAALGVLAAAAAAHLAPQASNRYLMGTFVVLGLGTGLLYPVMAAAVCDHTSRGAQATAIGAFRFARDSGYAVGAVAGLVADAGSAPAAMGACALACAAAAAAVARWYRGRR